MEAEYGTYEYDKEKGMEKDQIGFWLRQAACILTFELSCMMYEEAKKLTNHVNRPGNWRRPCKLRIYSEHKVHCKIYIRKKHNQNIQACICPVQEV